MILGLVYNHLNHCITKHLCFPDFCSRLSHQPHMMATHEDSDQGINNLCLEFSKLSISLGFM
jgi:hypothetical protein